MENQYVLQIKAPQHVTFFVRDFVKELLAIWKSRPQWTKQLVKDFTKLKQTLAHATQVTHWHPTVTTSLIVNASDIAVGAVLQQKIDGHWRPHGFFSRKLKPAETRYSTFGRELLAIYLAIKHFRHLLVGRHFCVLTDHKPLTYVFDHNSDKYTPRETRQLGYISEFTTDIRHVQGKANMAADALSRRQVNATSTPNFVLDYDRLAEAQATDLEIQEIAHSKNSDSVMYTSIKSIQSCTRRPYWTTTVVRWLQLHTHLH